MIILFVLSLFFSKSGYGIYILLDHSRPVRENKNIGVATYHVDISNFFYCTIIYEFCPHFNRYFSVITFSLVQAYKAQDKSENLAVKLYHDFKKNSSYIPLEVIPRCPMDSNALRRDVFIFEKKYDDDPPHFIETEDAYIIFPSLY